MGNDRSLVLLQGLMGGLLAGVALTASGPWWMVPALALLWAASCSAFASAIWGGVAVMVSHRWLLALHPLMWIGVPAQLSLWVAIGIWLACALWAALLLAAWSCLVHRLPLRGSFVHAVLVAGLWGLAEVVLSQSPLFWIGVGGSVLPADPPLAALSRWIGGGGLAALQLLIGWWLWRLLTLSRREPGGLRLLVSGLITLLLLHGLGAWALERQGVCFADPTWPHTLLACGNQRFPLARNFLHNGNVTFLVACKLYFKRLNWLMRIG